ncbi:MAG: hypothetical protein HC890_17175 [Chloroflexaceae bacterium]|nr:hypothetical protein [Chloroflexaceae bacterium]
MNAASVIVLTSKLLKIPDKEIQNEYSEKRTKSRLNVQKDEKAEYFELAQMQTFEKVKLNRGRRARIEKPKAGEREGSNRSQEADGREKRRES